jgi:hypothetical protein
MKNKVIAILAAVIVLLGGGVTAYQMGGNTVVQKVNVLGAKDAQVNMLTTSTNAIYIGRDTNSLNLNVAASTTFSGTLSFVPYFSNDSGCNSSTDSSIYWFGESTVGVSSTAISLASPAVYTHAVTTGTNKFNISFSNLTTDCMKFVFYSNTPTATSTMWVEASLKSN